MKHNIILLIIITQCLFACKNASVEAIAESETASRSDTISVVQSVQVKQANKKAFQLKILTTGKLSARQQLKYTSPSSGLITQLALKVGQVIQKGELIAQLDDETLQFQLRQQQFQLEKAILEKNDMLILQGGKEGDDASVPPHKLKNILTASGVNSTQLIIEKTQKDIEKTKIYAPFGGIISEVFAQEGEQATIGKPLCMIINHQTFEAIFHLTEQEALQIKKGQLLQVSPMAQSNWKLTARVTTIQPIVSKDGLVEIRAAIQTDKTNRLLEGMSLNIEIQQAIGSQIVVPKQAIVLRSGREVIFTYDENSSLAKWNYVTIAHQNDTEAAIAEGIKAGDKVIVEGQLNLSHDAEVRLPKSSRFGKSSDD